MTNRYTSSHDPDNPEAWMITDTATGNVIKRNLTAWDTKTLEDALNQAQPLTELQHQVTEACQAWATEDTQDTRESLYQAISTLRAAHRHTHRDILKQWPGITRPIKRAA